MPQMTKYDPGVPCWVDLATTDLAAGLRFYSALFGWVGEDLGEEAGHYTLVSKDGMQVAALMAAQDGPPHWTTYVNVDDVDRVAQCVEPTGGTVIVAPMTVMNAGRMAVFSDSTGAAVAAWQPGDHIGAQLVNEPGSFVWNELATSDPKKSKTFYSEVFGWQWGGSDEYVMAEVAGRSIAGVMPRPPSIPAEVPDHWLVYFATADIDGDVTRVASEGADVLVQPTEIPGMGRFSVLADPQGAAFALFER